MAPTRKLIWLVAAGILLVPLSLLGPAGVWIPLVYNLVLVGFAILTWVVAPRPTNLLVKRHHDPVLSVLVPNKIEISLFNDGAEKIEGLFRDEAPADFEVVGNEAKVELDPGESFGFTYSVRPRGRGSDYFRGAFLRQICPFGLMYRDYKLGAAQPVRVYPNVLAVRQFDLLMQKGRMRQAGVRKTRTRGLGTEFESLREYTEGDDYRKMDWKASARRGKLVVRQYEMERNQAVVLVLDTGKRMLAEVDGVRKMEFVLNAVLMLAHAAAISGDQVGLLVFSDSIKRFIPPKKGNDRVRVIIDAIHNLQPEPVQSDYETAFSYLARRWKRRALVVSFTEVEDPVQAREAIRAYSPLVARHLSLMVSVKDPRVQEMTALALSDNYKMFQRTAAVWTESQRDEASALLNHARLHYLHSDPELLIEDLLEFYFDVKERALL
ncbi:MAG: DUF58 domain-containing protein [Fimbriimonadaceae bacterium]